MLDKMKGWVACRGVCLFAVECLQELWPLTVEPECEPNGLNKFIEKDLSG